MSVPISPVQLLLAALLMLVSVLLSWRLRLGLGRDIVIASVRMTVQLLLLKAQEYEPTRPRDLLALIDEGGPDELRRQSRGQRAQVGRWWRIRRSPGRRD